MDTSRVGGLGGSFFYGQREFRASDVGEDLSIGSLPRLEQMAGVALSLKFNEQVSFSIGGRYQYLRSYSALSPNAAYWTGDMGLSAKLSPEWMLYVSAQDLLANDLGLNYRSYSLALSGNVAPLLILVGQVEFYKEPEGSLATGFVSNEAKPTIALAAKYQLQKNLGLSTGFTSLASWEQSFLSAGLGYGYENFKIDYAFRMSLGDSSGQYHGLAFNVAL